MLKEMKVIKDEKYISELDYLEVSLNFLNERHAKCLAELRGNKKEMESLKVDNRKIKTKRLLEAGTKAFNHFSMQNTSLSNTIKDIRLDIRWVKRLIIIVKEWFAEHE